MSFTRSTHGSKARLCVTLLAAVIVVMATAPGALAQDYPIEGGEVDVVINSGGDDQLDPGDSLTVSGNGFTAGAQVVVTIASEPVVLATVNANAQGAFSVTAVIPADFPEGNHTIKASGASPTGTLVLETPVQVGGAVASQSSPTTVAGTAAGSQGTLPFTGSSTLIMLAVALGLLGAGALFIVGYRRTSQG